MTDAAAASTDRRSADTIADETPTYELFIGVLTIFSLANAALLILVDLGPVHDILYGTDTLLCIVFMADFVGSLRRAPDKSAYFWPNGLVDLLGSVPGVAVLRILRVFRLRRIVRLLGRRGLRSIVRSFLARRAEAALYLIIVMSLLVLTIGSSLVVTVEGAAPGSNIRTGGDAFWWAFVTITTVGYGDRFPVTSLGRLVAMLTMAVGIGIFGVLTSYLSTALLAPKKSDADDAAPTPVEPPAPAEAASGDAVAEQLAALRREIADLRTAVEKR